MDTNIVLKKGKEYMVYITKEISTSIPAPNAEVTSVGHSGGERAQG